MPTPQEIDSTRDPPLVVPLRQRQLDGTLYSRPREVETLLVALAGLPGSALVERARIDNPDDPGYLPSECVLYFVRRPPQNNADVQRDLFVLLRKRVLAAVPVPSRRIPGSGKLAESAVDLEIREAVLHKFQVLLCNDRRGYEELLDYYECRFNSALASLRATARRDARREAARTEPLESDSDTSEPSPEVEAALSRLRPPLGQGDGVDFLYRSKLLRAISLLPADERRVIELILQGFPIDSTDEETDTIAKILGCVEKTVRNRRDRAFLKLRDALKEEEDA